MKTQRISILLVTSLIIGAFISNSKAALAIELPDLNTVIRFCNTTSLDLGAAYTYFKDSKDGWVSQGWYIVNAHSCRNLQMPQIYSDNVYIYAQANGGKKTWHGNDSSFCVDNNEPFEIPSSDKDISGCIAAGFSMVKMSKFKVSIGVNTWNFSSSLFDPL